MERSGEFWRKLLYLVRRSRFDRELEEEMQFHLAMKAEQNRENGVRGDEAEYAARKRFGNPTLLREDSREAWGWGAMERFAKDLRYAVRMLRNNPGFTAVACITLALGIGVNSAIFTIVDAFLFRPVLHSDRLVSIAERTTRDSALPVAYPNFVDWRRQNQVFDRLAAYQIRSFVLSDVSGAEEIPGLWVSVGFLQLLGVQPVLGRDFLPNEQQAGGDPVVILSYELWQRHFGGEPSVLGRMISLTRSSSTVVGIAPPGFRLGPRADVFLPMDQIAGSYSRARHDSLYAIGRLKPGITVEQARSHMDMIAAGLEQQYPNTNTGHRVAILPFGRVRAGEIKPVLMTLMCAVAFVLLIACANVSNLLFSRAAGRGREVAIRKVLGAGRGRLIRQLLAESLVLAGIGGAAGLIFGWWGCSGLLALIGDLDRWPGGEPLGGVPVDARVFLFTLLVTAFTGLISGLTPAFQASKGDLTPALKAGGLTGGTDSGRRSRSALVTMEVALALVLLTGAGLLLRSLYQLLTVDPGIAPRNVLTLKLANRVATPSNDLCRRIIEEVQALPGVESAAMAFPLPFGQGLSVDGVYVEGRPLPARDQAPMAKLHYVSAGYFRTVGMRLLRGRWFAASDDERTVIINETMARKFWPNGDPIGRHFRLGRPDAKPYTVAGIAADTKEYGLHEERAPEAYLAGFSGTGLVVRTATDPLGMVSVIRDRIRSVDKEQAVFDAVLLEQRIPASVRDERILTVLLAIFAYLALLLAAVGIYGVVAHSVNRRTPEIGIRIALGAAPANVVGMVVAQGMRPVLIGICLGLAGAYGATHVLGSMLFGVKATDPLTFGAVVLLLISVALLACFLPARRATRVAPLVALRHE